MYKTETTTNMITYKKWGNLRSQVPTIRVPNYADVYIVGTGHGK